MGEGKSMDIGLLISTTSYPYFALQLDQGRSPAVPNISIQMFGVRSSQWHEAPRWEEQ
jgi:hypothetical protein